MNYPVLGTIHTHSFKDLPLSAKDNQDMARSMITIGQSHSSLQIHNERGIEPNVQQFEKEERIETSSMILSSRKSRKYSEAVFNQDIHNLTRSKVLDMKIIEPLRFGDKEREKDKYKPFKNEDIGKNIFGIEEHPNDIIESEYPLIKRSNIVFSSSQLQKNSHVSPKLAFHRSNTTAGTKEELHGKKSINNYINIRTQEVQSDPSIYSQKETEKIKTPLIKSANKSSYIFKREEISQSAVLTRSDHKSFGIEQNKLNYTEEKNISRGTFTKKPSVDSKNEPPSPFKKVTYKEKSTLNSTPVESLRSSIDKINRKDFYFGKRLGKGKFGEVFLVRHKTLGFLSAMKIISKKVIATDKIQRQLISEIKIQLFLEHPNIVALYGVFADEDNIYLLQEPCLEGQLYQKIKKVKKLAEKEAATLVKQVVIAVDYLHSEKIIHRDIKPENILLSNGVIKIADFGWAAFHNDQFRDTFCGTPLYLSPQLLNQSSYNQKVDSWAIGILTYEMMIGRIPFKISNQQQLQKILHEQIVFPENIQISDAAKNFILLMLERDPLKRPDLERSLAHPFMNLRGE